MKGDKDMPFVNPDPSVISDKDLYIFDMDGTIYLGFSVFPFAVRFINHLRASGRKVLFFTNNASAGVIVIGIEVPLKKSYLCSE